MGIKSSRYCQHNSLTQVIQHPSSPAITTIELSLSTSSLVGFKPHIFLHSFSSHHTVHVLQSLFFKQNQYTCISIDLNDEQVCDVWMCEFSTLFTIVVR